MCPVRNKSKYWLISKKHFNIIFPADELSRFKITDWLTTSFKTFGILCIKAITQTCYWIFKKGCRIIFSLCQTSKFPQSQHWCINIEHKLIIFKCEFTRIMLKIVLLNTKLKHLHCISLFVVHSYNYFTKKNKYERSNDLNIIIQNVYKSIFLFQIKRPCYKIQKQAGKYFYFIIIGLHINNMNTIW